MTFEQIKNICDLYDIRKYEINPDMSIDVHDSIHMGDKMNEVSVRQHYFGELSTPPLDGKLPLKFRNIYGTFMCDRCGLTSLEGSPEYVSGNFCVYDNQLTSLEYSPKSVGGYFTCSSNKITSLVGITQNMGYAQLVYVYGNRLTNLNGFPRNSSLNLVAHSNNIRDIYDISSIGSLSISYNPVYMLICHFIDREDKNQWIEFFNDCDIIRDDHIIWERLVFFYDYLDTNVENMYQDIKKYYNII